jgi:hypothetical protein
MSMKTGDPKLARKVEKTMGSERAIVTDKIKSTERKDAIS